MTLAIVWLDEAVIDLINRNFHRSRKFECCAAY